MLSYRWVFRILMLRLHSYIRRKRILRRIAAVSLFLIAIELLCPALCGDRTFAEIADPGHTISHSKTDNRETITTKFVTPSGDREDGSGPFCNDECLCHAVAIPTFLHHLETATVRRDRSAVSYTHAIFSSPSPPYIPPKFS